MERYIVRYPDMLQGHQSEGYSRYPHLLDIEREVTSILEGMPQDVAVDVAYGVSGEINGYPHIPGTVIFSREGITPDIIWAKLLQVIRTPDYDTPSFNPELKPYVEAVAATLRRVGYDGGLVGAIAAKHVIRVTGGDIAAVEYVYQDKARRWPVESVDWQNWLNHQFKGQLQPQLTGSDIERELAQLMQSNNEIAERHSSAHNRRNEGEDTVSFIERTLSGTNEQFDISTEEGFISAANLMDRVWRDYRRETYALRGIPYEY